VLAPNGVAAIISFHSLEDAEVKRAFADEATWEPLAKKPVTAGDVELGENPRARSAKLRAARRRAPEEASLDPREARMRKYEAKKARRFGGAG
jgi:16S rRNA (cytosine1402-N4)-methyltransferase